MKERHKILLASIFGNTLEYYEFSILAVFAIQIGKAFFPDQDDTSQLLLTLGLFTVGFISRPIGSLIFGHFGDKIGRKISLVITIGGMSIATLAIGFMPSFDAIGIWAPILVLILRLCQGVFIGGEGAGSAIYVLENNLSIKRDIVGGILITSNIAGVVIASIIGIIINSTVGLDSASWRIAFIAGGIAGLLIAALRTTLPETQSYDQVSIEEIPKIPAFELFSKYWRQVVVVMAFGGLASGVSYVIKGYIVLHFQRMGFPKEQSFILLMFTSLVFAILPPFLGYFSNRYTYRRFIMLASTLIILLFIPVWMLISSYNLVNIFIGLSILAILAAAINTPLYIYFSDMFPTEVRYSGIALSYNLGIALVGAFTPIISTILVDRFQSITFAPALYIVLLAIIYLILDTLMHKKISST